MPNNDHNQARRPLGSVRSSVTPDDRLREKIYRDSHSHSSNDGNGNGGVASPSPSSPTRSSAPMRDYTDAPRHGDGSSRQQRSSEAVDDTAARSSFTPEERLRDKIYRDNHTSCTGGRDGRNVRQHRRHHQPPGAGAGAGAGVGVGGPLPSGATPDERLSYKMRNGLPAAAAVRRGGSNPYLYATSNAINTSGAYDGAEDANAASDSRLDYRTSSDAVPSSHGDRVGRKVRRGVPEVLPAQERMTDREVVSGNATGNNGSRQRTEVQERLSEQEQEQKSPKRGGTRIIAAAGNGESKRNHKKEVGASRRDACKSSPPRPVVVTSHHPHPHRSDGAPPPLDKRGQRELAMNMGVGAVAVPGIGREFLHLPVEEVVLESEGSGRTSSGGAAGNGDEEGGGGNEDRRVGRRDDKDGSIVFTLCGWENKDGSIFFTLCGFAVARRKCLVIGALIVIAVAAIVVGAMAGTGAFGSGDEAAAASDGAEASSEASLPDNDGAGQAPATTSGPTASPTSYTPPECRQVRLPRDEVSAEDYFGTSVSTDGYTTVIGADAGKSDGTTSKRSGSVYVYTRDDDDGGTAGTDSAGSGSSSGWKERARLRTNDNLKGNLLGRSVSVHGDTAVFGALDRDDTFFEEGFGVGCAFVFRRRLGGGGGGSTALWEQEAKLVPDDINVAGVAFGNTVAVHGDTVIVGSDFTDLMSSGVVGSAFVFARSENSGRWAQQEEIVPSDGESHDRFGHSVALYEDTAVVGAVRADANGENSGAAYVYTRLDGKWTEQAKLLPKDGAANDAFGSSVAIQGDTVVVGADSDATDGLLDSGSAYVFVHRSRTTWVEQAKLLARDGRAGDSFGHTVSVDGDTIIVGTRSGAVYVFGRDGATWTERTKLLASTHQAKSTSDGGPAGDKYGESVDLSGNTVVIGSYGDDEYGEYSGSAYSIQLC